MRKPDKQILVIGGGASGMVAAIEAARFGARVTLLEKESRVGRKLLATGNGRCNYANVLSGPHHFHGNDSTIIEAVLSSVPVDEILTYFELLGITPKEETEGKIYPYSDQGSNVLDLLRYEMERQGVKILTGQRVIELKRHQDQWQVRAETGELFMGDCVILATGGKAGSQFGADGSGYRLAESLGHTVTSLFPALVQIKLGADWLKPLKGVKWQGAASIVLDGKPVRRERGELLFTEYGISGPPILQLSRKVHLPERNRTELWIHLLDGWTQEQISEQLLNRFHMDPEKPMELCLLGLFHKRLIPVLLKEAGIREMKQPGSHVSSRDLRKLSEICANWKIPVTGTLSWQQAQVTAGGIITKEIHPKTMASRFNKGLYLTGEVMDVDGDCGGFNLYWAWATGLLAARHAAGGEESVDAANPDA